MPSDISDHRRTTTVKNHHHGPPPPQEPENLPCPRCNSTSTKFCYYNNYNFSQPRHFCKSCRRYWTQGGTLRDIPVGGGSRKNAKRSRVSTVAAAATPVSTPFAGVHGGATQCGGFTALLGSPHGAGFFLPEVCGFDQDGSFGLGRTIWPFAGVGDGGVGGLSGGAGSVWRLESEGCFVLPELAISMPGNAMK
ncbi:hypothetical protein R6Q57_014113 [Mikania cordata]